MSKAILEKQKGKKENKKQKPSNKESGFPY